MFERPEAPELSPDALMHRWTSEELARVSNYLNSKNPDLYTLDDHYLVVEFIAQRYLPADEKISHLRWQVRLAKMKAQVDENIRRLEAGEPPPPQPPRDEEFTKWMLEKLSKTHPGKERRTSHE